MITLAARLLLRLSLSFVQEGELNGNEAQPLAEGSDFNIWPAFLNMVIALAVVIALIFLVLWLIRKFTGGKFTIGSGGLMKIAGTLPLGDRRFITVLRVAKRYYLVGITAGSITNLGELNAEEVERALEQVPVQGDSSFAKILSRIRGDKNEAKQ
jgi:flagellar biosynthetic protein FliO